MNAIVGQTVIFGRRPGHETFRISVEIGTPYQITAAEWACPVSLAPLHTRLRDIHGANSFQSLCLAIRLAHDLLKGFVVDGGALTHENGEEFSLDSYGIAP